MSSGVLFPLVILLPSVTLHCTVRLLCVLFNLVKEKKLSPKYNV